MPNTNNDQEKGVQDGSGLVSIGVAHIAQAHIDRAIVGPANSDREAVNPKDEIYLKLYMYYQDKADKVKEAMFKTLTWTVGFAAALLGIIFASLVKFESSKAAIPLSWLVIILSVAGLFICVYSLFMLTESGKHITNNWERSKQCKRKIKGLEVCSEIKGSKEPLTFTILKWLTGVMIWKWITGRKIWRQLAVIVILFILTFTAILYFSIVSTYECKQHRDDSTFSFSFDFIKKSCPFTTWGKPKTDVSKERTLELIKQSKE